MKTAEIWPEEIGKRRGGIFEQEKNPPPAQPGRG